jgi:hypothetical protein
VGGVNSFRDYAYTQANGYASFGGFTLDTYFDAWRRGNFTTHFKNPLIITIPVVLFTLALASGVAFVVSWFSFRFNLAMLGFFTRGQPAPAAGAPDPGVPDVPRDPGARLHQRVGHVARQPPRSDPGEHRLPDRLLRLRAEQLHEDAAA